MKLAFLRVLSSNISLLCPRFLRTPRAPSEQTRSRLPTPTSPGMVPRGEHSSLHPGLVSLGLSVLPGQCELITARLLLEKVGHMCLLASCSLSAQWQTQALTLLFLPGLHFGSFPAASFCETCRNQVVLRLLLFFQMEENC